MREHIPPSFLSAMNRLREFRNSQGSSPAEFASILNISIAALSDLEGFDDELSDSVSVDTLCILPKLGLPLSKLFDVNTSEVSAVSLDELVQRLRDLENARSGSLEEAGDNIGFDIKSVVDGRIAITTLPILFCILVCPLVKIDYRSIIKGIDDSL